MQREFEISAFLGWKLCRDFLGVRYFWYGLFRGDNEQKPGLLIFGGVALTGPLDFL